MAARSRTQLLVLAALLAGAECQDYGAIGAAHREAEVHASSGGTLTSTLTIDAFRYNGPTAQFWGRAFNGGFPGPTFRIKKGDTWTLNLVNAMGPNPTEEQEHNSYKDPSTTNVHTHGLHISGESPGDNVLRVVEPGASDVYRYELPDDHAGGTFWYHPHHHGSTALQVGGGAAGMIIVEDTAGDIPDIIANAPEVLVMAQYFSISGNPSLHEIAAAALDEVTVQDFVGDRDFVLINGQYEPVISMDAGKWYRFRIVNSGTMALLAIAATGCDTELIAKDGIYLPTAPRQITTAYIIAGGRADIMVRCPVGSFSFESGVRGVRGARNQFTGLLATLSVTEVAGQAADPDLTSFQARKPNYLSDLTGNVAVDGTFALDLGPGGGGCRINGASWESEANVINSQEVGGVYEWDVSGVQGHPFHLHVNSYQIASVSDATGYLQVGDWHDTLYNPSGDNGAITVRYQTDRFTGKAMMHCHFLPHEDLGCMAIATITGVEGTPGKIAAGFGGGFGSTPSNPPTPAPSTPAPDTPAPNTPVPETPAPDTPSPQTAVTFDCRDTTEVWSTEKRRWCCANSIREARRFGGLRCPRRREIAAPMPKLSSGGLESNTTMRVEDIPSSKCPLSPLMVVSLAANLIAVLVIISLIYRRRTQPQEDKSAATAPEVEAGTHTKTAAKLEVDVELDSEVVTSSEGSPGPSPQPSSAPSPLPLARKNNPLAEC